MTGESRPLSFLLDSEPATASRRTGLCCSQYVPASAAAPARRPRSELALSARTSKQDRKQKRAIDDGTSVVKVMSKWSQW